MVLLACVLVQGIVVAPASASSSDTEDMMEDVFAPGFPFEGPMADESGEDDEEKESEDKNDAGETEASADWDSSVDVGRELRSAPNYSPSVRREAPARASQASSGARAVTSTAYCHTGAMASGKAAYSGAAAMNGTPLGSRYQVLSGPRAGETFVVEDRIGGGSQFDIAYPGNCSGARMYGRRVISIRQI